MTTEAGHAPNRIYVSQAGNLHLNGGKLFDAGGNDVAAVVTASLVGLTATAAEINQLHGVTPGTVPAGGALVVAAGKSLDTLTITALTAGTLAMTGALSLQRSTVAAAGTNQGTAAALNPGFNSVTGASGTNGVILPTGGTPALPVVVKNTHQTNALLVFPPTGGAIDAAAANASVSLAAGKSAVYFLDSTNQWYSLNGA